MSKVLLSVKKSLLVTMIMLFLPAWCLALSVASETVTSNALRLGGVEIIGQQEQLRTIPGAAAVVDEETMILSQPLSVGEALRKVSGVYVRDEDGQGLRPNISIRGIDGHRSVKLLLLEDGLPISLAPYGENSAYYAPLIDRTSRIEVLKGSGSILYGPQTVAGVINYITENPPLNELSRTKIVGGTNGYFNLQSDYGNTFDSTGVLLQGLYKKGDGFRKGTPFGIYDFRAKLVTVLNDEQELMVKAQYYNEDSTISYAGLTQDMYDDNPNQNPAIHDALYVERLALSATHTHHNFFSGRLDTSFYGYATKRDFWRQQYDRVENNSTSYERISGNGNDNESLFWKNENRGNNRSYKVVGIEPRYESGNFKGGVKIHYETEDNKQYKGLSGDARSGSVNTDERRDTFATAAYIQNRYELSQAWDLTAGLRIESYRQGRDILKSVATQNVSNQTDLITEFIPGLGTTYDLSSESMLFAGVHRGFAPPKFADALNGNSAIDQKLEAERSWNYETGIRTKVANANVNVTAFFYDYQNQIINAAISSGYSKANAGKSQIIGLEADISQEWQLGTETVFYGNAVATYVNAQSKQGDYENNRLPYSPQYTGSIGTGIRHKSWDSLLEMVYVGSMFSDEANTVAGSADGTVGEIPSYIVWNMSSRYTLGRLAFFATVKNIFNTTYIASRRPEGIFPGTPQQLQIGVTMEI